MERNTPKDSANTHANTARIQATDNITVGRNSEDLVNRKGHQKGKEAKALKAYQKNQRDHQKGKKAVERQT